MGIGEAFSRLFGGVGGGGNKSAGGGKSSKARRSKGDRGIYFYIRLEKGEEIVELRLDPQHDLAPDYETGTYFSNKTIIGPKTIERAQATFYFDENKRFDRADISGGTLVEEEN